MYTRVVGWAGPAVPCSLCRGNNILHRYRGKGPIQPTHRRQIRSTTRSAVLGPVMSTRADGVEAWTWPHSCAN